MNILSKQPQETLLLQFPKNIKLSYEKVIHNKVYESVNHDTNKNETKDKIFMAIPKGRKAFFWFHQGNVYSLILSFNGGNQIETVQKINEFDSSSSELNGSVFYGTLVFLSQLKKQMISIEDVFYYKNENVSHRFFIDKLKWIHALLQLTNSSSSRIVWGLPILRTSQKEVLENIQEVQGQMTIYCILIRSLKENKPSNKILYANLQSQKEIPQMHVETPEQNLSSKKENLFTPLRISNVHGNCHFASPEVGVQRQPLPINHLKCNPPREDCSISNVHRCKIDVKANTTTNRLQTKMFPKMKYFNVKADLQNDIYHLYEDDTYVDVAYIPDYKTSVKMNRLFRNIKENENLDALEESDDEEEFENDKEDRFVDLEKVLKMQCYLHSKFRKWVPL